MPIGKRIGNWWRAEDFAPERAPGVSSRRRAYADLQKRMQQEILQGGRHMRGLGGQLGAGGMSAASGRYGQGAQRATDYMGVDWEKDLADAFQRARARQAYERKMRQTATGQLVGDVASEYKDEATQLAMNLLMPGAGEFMAGGGSIQDLLGIATVQPGASSPSSYPPYRDMTMGDIASSYNPYWGQ